MPLSDIYFLLPTMYFIFYSRYLISDFEGGSLLRIEPVSTSVFLSDPGVLGSDLWVGLSLTKRGCANLTDVTLADQAINSILTDNVNP